MVLHACNFSTWEVEAGGLEVHCYSQPPVREVEASLGYMFKKTEAKQAKPKIKQTTKKTTENYF